jgi:hypothetical protein
MSNEVGTWDAPYENALKIVGVHAVVLHTGKVLYFCFDQRAVGQLNANHDLFQRFFNDPNSGSYQIWDPAVPAAGPVKPIGRNSFCAGQCALADGTIFVAGGQDGAGAADLTGEWDKVGAALAGTDNGALKDVHTYDAVQDRWVRWPDMADGRYYPTCLTLDDGTAFVAGGLSNLMQWVASGANWCENDQFETFPPGLLEFGPNPQQNFTSADQYPIMVLLPGTRRLFVHIHTKTSIFDLDSHSFIDGAEFMPPGVGRQTYPLQTGHVLLPQKEGDPPRILIVGGSTATGFDFNTHSDAPAVRAAFIFEYNAQSPPNSRWRNTKGAPTVARLLSDTVLLPDGKVFVVNGISQGAAAGHSGPAVFQADLFDPVTETFKAMAAPSVSHPRGYHATAVLLPDARVAIAGNTETYNPGEMKANDDVSIEIFNPPYLFAGPRPVVVNVPAEIEYGATINIDNSGNPGFERVVMMRPCAVTHSVDMNQRAIQLETSASIGRTLDVKIPKDRSLAPPGHYMLFFLSAAGVPSKASFVILKDLNPKFPPVYLGTYQQDAKILEVFDGDITLEKIDQHCDVTLESRHGSITINHKVVQHCYANLTAHTTVHIGQGVDQHSIVEILAGGDVTIGEKINESSEAHITSSGSIDIQQKVDNTSAATLRAGTTVHVGEKIDQHSTFDVVAEGDVTIDQKLDQHSHSTITSNKGSITVTQGMSGNADATLRAPNGFITMDTIDDGCSLNWSARDLRCNHKNGTITRIP